MEGAESYKLRQVPWNFFCTLTLAGRLETAPVRRARVLFAWLRQVGRAFHLSSIHDFPWAVRSERGGLTGRFHYHALIAGYPGTEVTPRVCFSLMNLWEGLSGSISRVRPYSDELDGVAYVFKGLSCYAGRSAYEVGVFGRTGDVTLSRRLLAMMASRKKRSQSWVLRHESKRGTPRAASPVASQ
jgi:hypothetical protein